jgi:PAS domain S-box-containing protein
VSDAARVLDALDDGVFTLDEQTRVTTWNHEMEMLAGVRHEQIVGSRVFERFPLWKERGEHVHVEAALAGRIALSPSFPVASATNRRFQATYRPLHPGVVVVVRDMTESDAVRDQLRETDVRFQIMADTSPVLLWMSGTDGLCTFFNQRWLAFTGRAMEMELGNGWAEGVHAEDFQRCMTRYLDSFVARKSFRMEYRLRRADGEYRWLLDTGVPRYLPSGAFAGFIGSCIDITEFKRVRDELDVRVRERTAELEAFAYSVSHDLRAPLRRIDGFSQALIDEHGAKLDPSGYDYLQRVRDAAQRMGALIDGLLQLSRIGRSDPQLAKCDLAEITRTAAVALREREPARDVELQINGDMIVRGDARLLRIAVDNLLGNAWKFTSRTPQPRIAVSSVEQNGERVFVVRDNGAGFDPAYAHKLFGAFQRLHSSDDFPGTGIGLATVHRIVRRHGGRIWAESVLGAGATFYFTLPEPAPEST